MMKLGRTLGSIFGSGIELTSWPPAVCTDSSRTLDDIPEVYEDERGDRQEHDRDRVSGHVDFVDGVGRLKERKK